MSMTTTARTGHRATGDLHDVIDPSDGSVVDSIPISSEADCDAAVDTAARAFEPFARLAPRVRAEMLRTAYELMVEESEQLARLVSRENGKILADARAEVAYAAEFFRWFSEEAVRVSGDFRLAPSGDKTIVVTHEPVGVSLLITPWNFPAAMATRKIGPAIAAGCTVVIKPAMETPLTTLAIVDLLHRAGVPDGVVTVVTPSPAGPAVSRMLRDPRIRNLSFTGSTEVGRLLLKQAADRVIRTSMELGGNAPFVVLDDADLDEAIAGAMVAKLRNGGAACTAANRFYVSRSIADEFSARLTKAMGAIVMAPGLTEGAGLGASVSVGERDKIAGLVDASVASGATLLIGGEKPEGPGAFYPPTVLTMASDNPILDQEIFGPVAPVVAVDSDDEAVALANASEFGLISYVFSGDLARAMRVSKRIQSGMVAINRGVISDPAAPFGGYKQSGLGREGGFAGIHEFLESKYIGVEI
ncbi:MAG: succinate-semialdehyde dehydrogenase / glutarate-semialdehyde dehydrogenase [Microbacteriaceae bacterium]|nr:succinate-semialdehyde dehydrogenase / glutarate-semialdehyde dehydrogenase [Microbacteriaceae bacterium]